MRKSSLNNGIIISILIIGAILRISLFYINPPNNSFDDHLEVIKIYANTLTQPAASKCWECYQPPCYYYISAAVFNFISSMNTSYLIVWKIVQFINPFLSILVLIFCYKILLLFNLSKIRNILYISFIAVLPIDLFTSSMIGNDYLLVFSAVLSFFYFLKSIDDINSKSKLIFKNYIFLSIFVIIGSLSKQHGLILLTFPTIVIFALLLKKGDSISYFLPIYLLVISISLSNEFWKFQQTGKFIVSNQDFFDYAEGQYPGSFKKVELTTFRIYSLFDNPFISNQTSASLPTELFARTFFDYEWRFLSPKIPFANTVGRLAYLLGIFWIIYFFGTLFPILLKKNRLRLKTGIIIQYAPLIVGILFFAVPFLQTYRYPYFSSMKSTFALPGIIILLLAHAFFTRTIYLSRTISIFLILSNISFGILLIYSIYSFLPITVNHLSGPLWQIP